MNINSVKDYYRYRVTAEGVKKPTGETKLTNSGGANANANATAADAVSISSQGSLRAQLLSETRENASDFNSTLGGDRLAELREQYAGDACPITSMSLAESILVNVLGIKE